MSPPTTFNSGSVSNDPNNLHVSSPLGSPTLSSASNLATITNSKRKRKSKIDQQADEVLTMVGERLRNSTTKDDDAFDIVGKNVAAKLRILPKETRIFTEKLINDLLFEAEMGNIDRNTKIFTSANNPTNLMNTNYNRNFYSSPSTYRPVSSQLQLYESTQSHSVTPPPQQLPYQPCQDASIKSPYDINVSTFFGNYQASENNK